MPQLASWLLTCGLALAAVGVFACRDSLHATFLAAAHMVDEEGAVKNPKWLLRPILTCSGVLLAYALLRAVYEGRTGRALEAWVFAAGEWPLFRFAVLVATFLIVPILFALFVHSAIDPDFRSTYYGEDQLFENATAAALFLGGVLMLAAAVRLARHPVPFKAALAGIATMGFATIVLALEEISYGQRLFGWGTPAAMAEVNLQAETNIHNLWTHDTQATLAWMVGMAILAGLALSALLRRSWDSPLAAILPHQAFLVLAVGILMLTSHPRFHELLEQVVGLFAVRLATRDGRGERARFLAGPLGASARAKSDSLESDCRV